jgi:hypothetical protein
MSGNGISVSLAMLLIKGIPECLIVAWGIHVFTKTPIVAKKYFFLSAIYILMTYLIRFTPITLGINTVLCMFLLIISFQIIYKSGLSRVIRSVVSSVIVLILIAISELLNGLLLAAMYGWATAEALIAQAKNVGDFAHTAYLIPSNIFFFLLVLAGYFVMKRIHFKDMETDGENIEKTGE